MAHKRRPAKQRTARKLPLASREPAASTPKQAHGGSRGSVSPSSALTPAGTPSRSSRQIPRASRLSRWLRFSRLRHRWRKVRRHVPPWVRSWQFWLVLLVAATLRLVAIRRSPFTSDDALLFLEAARAAHSHLLPGTGIFNSLLALNMPLYTWILLPFADQPMGMALLTAIANVLTVVGLYLFARRYFDPWAAFLGALLYATACYATWMSEFIWQQTLVPPLALLALATLYLGAVERKRHWLIPHALSLAALIQIYPVTATLLPLTLLGLILGWRAVSALDVIVTEAGVAALYLPTALFELASGGYDLRAYQAYLALPSHMDGQVFDAFSLALGPRPSNYLGAPTLYADTAGYFGWLVPVFFVLWALGTLWIVGVALLPAGRAIVSLALRQLRAPRDAPSPESRQQAKSSVRGGIPFRRARLLLLPWPLTLVLAALNHAAPVYDHYVFIVLPVIYLTIGVFLAELPFWIGRIAGGLLSIAQLILTGAFIFVLATGQATAASWGGVPIAAFTHALDVTQSIALERHARQVFIVSDPEDPYMGLYWAERQNNLAVSGGPQWVSYAAGACALEPAPTSGEGLLLAMNTTGAAYRELLRQPGTTLLRTIPMARGAAYDLYSLAPNRVPPARAIATFNGELRLDSAHVLPPSVGVPARLVTHWTALASTPPGPAVARYHVRLTFTGTTGLIASMTADCAPASWTTGEGMLLVVPLPSVITAHTTWQLGITVFRDTHSWYRPQIGTLTLETAKELMLNYVLLPLSQRTGPGIARPGGSSVRAATVTLPLAQLSP